MKKREHVTKKDILEVINSMTKSNEFIEIETIVKNIDETATVKSFIEETDKDYIRNTRLMSINKIFYVILYKGTIYSITSTIIKAPIIIDSVIVTQEADKSDKD